ncbi:MAG: tRNA pseudouridine(55) synthase TruB [Xanthomonadales bacterium]|nr:tRNA pseudouridine synthase B [Xanthomonadales bacterium]MCC6594784.1 tRNA pseudouridine(55) synthase TruB [Xanthomonadales bacterium]MCE7929959.1 tRNA pseudouridine(55) synthase TruB [Xanthomonadales bacterium PRO6]
MHRRPLHAVLLLDKPAGPTSNAALQRVKWLYRAEKAGHTGALDPLASGLLPICFGHATRLSSYLLEGDKGYRATARLGIRTDTLDADGGPVAEGCIDGIEAAQIESALAAFRGEIEQVPPMYSALKRDGRPLHELARAGIEVERAPRRVRIDRLELVEWTPPFLVLDVDCSTGTYIRSLVDDLGQALGCGAHVHALRRTWAAPFRQPAMHTLAELDAHVGDLAALDALLLPVEAMIDWMPQVRIDAIFAERFGHGNVVRPNDAPMADPVAVLSADGRLLGIGRSDGHGLHPVRVLSTP